MRTETLWQGQRRAARMHWWQILDRQASAASWGDVVDEAARMRFGLKQELHPVLQDLWAEQAC